MAPNLHPNLIIDLRAPKHATPPPLPPTTYLQQSRPDPRHQGLDSPDDVQWDPDPTQRSPTEKKTYGCFFGSKRGREENQKKTETQKETNIKCFFQKRNITMFRNIDE